MTTYNKVKVEYKMQSEWDAITFELNCVIGKLIALSESDDKFTALLASSYREEVTLTRDSIVAATS